MDAAVCEVTWGLRDGGLIAECGDCGATHQVTSRAVRDAWADAHRRAAHPSTERVRVVRVLR